MKPRKILEAILLDVLSRVPEGMMTQDTYTAIERGYRLPPQWREPRPTSAGYKILKERGIKGSSSLSKIELRGVPTEPTWQNWVRWARNSLAKRGLLDPSAGEGRWRLTPRGLETAARPAQILDREEMELLHQCTAASEGFVAQRASEYGDPLLRLSPDLHELLRLAREMSKPELDELLARARTIVKNRRGG